MIKKFIALPALVLSLSVSQSALAVHHSGHFARCMQGAYQKLHLTSDQETKIKAIKDQMRAGMQDKEVQMQAMHTEVKELVRADTLDESKLDALVNQKKEIIGEMMKNKIKTKHQIYHLLTDKQKETFVAEMEKCENQIIQEMKGADEAG